MSGWIRCELLLGGEQIVHINLSHIISIMAVEQGLRVKTVDGADWLVVGSDPAELIRRGQMRGD